MNTTQAENLRILIRYMDAVQVPQLDMAVTHHSCGTPACAYGHALHVQALKDRGIPSLVASGRFFGLSDKDDGRLFGGSLWQFEGGRLVNLVAKPTPQQWAAEARKVLAENGYSMDEAKPIPTVRERLDALYVPDASVLNSGEADPFKPGMTYDEFFAEARRLGI